MLLKSSWATETALSIFSSASRRVSSIMVQLLCTDGGVDHTTRIHARRAARRGYAWSRDARLVPLICCYEAFSGGFYAWPTRKRAKALTFTLPTARTDLMVCFGSFTEACSVSTTSLK